MKKQYLLFLTIIMCLYSFSSFCQTQELIENDYTDIENLSVYPNPVSQGKIYITSKNNAPKKIEIFNVLGKNIQTVIITQRELNISKLKAGVYIIKITENNISATRKLIVK
ncbi:T9SS type A sorting domain-containing protein [Formosa maritima]|uniref:T9SS type A sorting domain-containing protein n=1 Tax=Formosa maritima TaxID=2592046 RepID=A0A5D0G313_9FLAO|nr:T9SS type A sorting domain-containing protein [Formosa maritima]TYA53020.1 T9SS type A sorting domain-containing protein [Formosa maritima]